MMPDDRAPGAGLLLALAAVAGWLLASPPPPAPAHPPRPAEMAATAPAQPPGQPAAPVTLPAQPAQVHQRNAPPAPLPPAAAAGRAVGFALGQLGTPYRWGAAGPDAYDCSGLVFRAWRHAGLGWPRLLAAGQWRWLHQRGQDVSVGRLQPGDLLFYAHTPRDPASIHHVAMAVGTGRMVEAAAPGLPIRVVRVRRTGLAAAARPDP